MTNPTGTIVGLSGSLIGLNVGMLGLTNQYNNRNQVRLGWIKHNDNTVGGGGLTDGFVLKNYWRILFVKQTIKDAKYFPVNVF